MKKIVIDTRGADKGFNVFIEGAINSTKIYPNYSYVFVGGKEEIEKAIDGRLTNYEVIDAKETFLNTDSPMELVKGKEETSLVKSLLKLKSDDECVAMISAGSTGGFLVGSIFRLGLIEGIKFPALASPMINIHGKWFAFLDCGANLDIDANRLYKFAQMGSALMKSAFGSLENPRVALLNVGKEETKGNALCKEAYPLFKNGTLNFVGNIEGHEIYLDKADVIACDGFVGNVFLKGAEALSQVIENIVMSFGKDDPNIIKACNFIHKNFNYNDEGAAVFLGPKKICLKAHGHSTAYTIESAIRFAVTLHEGNFIEHIKEGLSK